MQRRHSPAHPLGGDTAAQDGGVGSLQRVRGLWGAFAAYLPGWGTKIRADGGGEGAGVSWVQLLAVGLSVLQLVLLWRLMQGMAALSSKIEDLGASGSTCANV
jgi:hypothetical protein